MAEVLGVVSGAVGVAGFALKIMETVQKLKHSFSKLRLVHANLEALLDELDLLATLLSRWDHTKLLESADADSRAALDCCEKAARNVLAVASNVQKGFDTGRRRGVSARIEFILKEKEIEENLGKLERAKSMLLLAQHFLLQLQVCGMSQSQRGDIYRAQSILNNARSTTCSNVVLSGGDTKHQGHVRGAFQFTYNLLIGTILVASFSSAYDRTRKMRFSPASWLWWSRGFEIIERNIFGGPQFFYRTFNVVTRTSPIRIACAYGDQAEIQRLFNEGLATPYDVTPEGSTLLHVAAAFHRANVCKLLLNYGVDASARNLIQYDTYSGKDFLRRTPLMMATVSDFQYTKNPRTSGVLEACEQEIMPILETDPRMSFKLNPQSALDTINILMDHGSPGPFDIYGEYDSAVAQFILPLEDSMTLMFKFLEDGDMEDVALSALNLYANAIVMRRNDLSSFGVKLLHNYCVQNIARMDQSFKSRTLFPCLLSLIQPWVLQDMKSSEGSKSDLLDSLRSLLSMTVSSDVLEQFMNSTKSWKELTRSCWMEGITLSTLCIYAFPLQTIIMASIPFSNGFTVEEYEISVNQAFRVWFSVLKEKSVDLHSYLEEERQYFSTLPLALRTTVDWGYNYDTLEFIRYNYCEVPSEVLLDFSFDDADGGPSVTVRLQEIDLEPVWAYVEERIREGTEMPGQWVE